MKSLRDYITESQQWIDSPSVGDDFGINIREECLLESHILEVSEDAIVIEADDRMLEMLERYHMLGEEDLAERIQRYGAVGSNRAQGFTVQESWNAMWQEVINAISAGYPDLDPTDSLKPVMQKYNVSFDELNRLAQQNGYADVYAVLDDFEQDGMLEDQHFQRVLELAGVPNAANNDPLAAKAADLAPVGTEKDPGTATTIDEVAMTGSSRQLQDYKSMTPQQFQSAHGMSKADWAMKHRDLLTKHGLQIDWTGKSAFDFVKDDVAVRPMDESVMSSIDMDLRHIAKTARLDALVDAMRGEFGFQTQQYLQDMMDDVEHSLERRGMQDANMQTKLSMLMDAVRELYAQEDLDEAEYQGREVQLNKPMQGDVAKFKVYVKDPKTGNVKKVNFGDKTMRIKKSNPARRRSFRARHRCENPGPKTKARYWSCRKW